MPEPVPPPDLRTAGTVEKGHGRIETRTLSASHECVAHLGWPGARQVCRIARTREMGGRVSRQIAYAVTSLPPEQAGPNRLLELWRDHWLIENNLHWRRDVVAREDQSRVRSGSAPQAMAALRNTTLFMLRGLPGSLRIRRAARAEERVETMKAAIRGFFERPCALSPERWTNSGAKVMISAAKRAGMFSMVVSSSGKVVSLDHLVASLSCAHPTA